MIDLLKILNLLSDHQVDYCLVGGLAAATYGSSMVTQDVDVACSMEAENLAKLHNAVAPINPRHRMAKPPRPFTLEDANSGLFKNIYLTTSLGQLDCLGEVKGIGDFNAVKRQSVEIDMGSFKLPIISLEALIVAKEAMARPRDLENAKLLRGIRDHN